MVAFCAGRKNSYGRDPLCQVEVLPLSPKYGSIESSRGSKKKHFVRLRRSKTKFLSFAPAPSHLRARAILRWVGLGG